METNKKQTAVNWIIQQIDNKRIGDGDNRSLINIFNEAKQIEREQIEEDFSQGMNNSLDYFIPNSCKSESQQYYEQTYGKNEKN